MKAIKSAIAAVFALGMLTALPSKSQAAVVIVNSTVGGVTCKQHTNGQYPENGHFYDCTNSTDAAYAVPQALSYWQNNLALSDSTYKYPKIGVALQTAPYANVYIFENAEDRANYLNLARKGQNAWTDEYQVTGTTLDPAIGQACLISNFVYEASGASYAANPHYTKLDSTTFKSSVSHEMGHCFDALSRGVGNFVSGQASFSTAMAKDKIYMGGSTGPYVNDSYYPTDYNYFSTAPINYLNSPSELFAEQFAVILTGATNPLYWTSPSGSHILLDNQILNYWGCTSFYVKLWMETALPPSAADYTNAGLSRCN